MDAFYASVEVSRKMIINKMRSFFSMCQMRENPALQHVPMAVGGEGMLVIIHYYFMF